MTILEIREVAIHQMYRKCVEEIGDSRQYGKWGKEKSWLGNHDFSKEYIYFTATPTKLTVTSNVGFFIPSSNPVMFTQSESVPSIQV